MPASITPMSATLVDRIPRGEGWLFEVKWDGVRAICFLDGERLSIFSRNGNRCEQQYPELGVVPHYVAAEQAILDGEIAVLDEKGISRFELIQPRIANTDANAVAHLARSRPVTLFLFDLLYLDGYDLRQCTLADRKRALKAVVEPAGPLRISEDFTEGEAMLEAAREAGLEGIIAKRASSCYEPRRSREWLKFKLVAEQEFLICGYTAGERDYFGALVLGVHEGGRLVWVGNVGTGFDRKVMEDLYSRMQPLVTKASPFGAAARVGRDVTWVRPELVCMVKFANWTQDGRLRAPVFLGLRDDVDPAQVRRERAAAAAPERRGPLLPGKEDEVSLTVDGRALKFTNLNKLYFPEDGYTKRDVLNYYDAVADLMLPHLKDRPLSLKRYPDGIHGEYFFQKNTPREWAPWLRTVPIYHEGNKGPTNYVLAEDRASLLYLANLGCIDQNPWMSRVGSLDNPDFVLIDLDPQECPFDMIVEAALLVKKSLDALGLAGYPKTTGGDGMHIYIPLEPVYSFEDSRNFAELLARLVFDERPDLFTTPRAVARRQKGRVYFDYLQNGKIKTIAAPYVLRAHPGAPVSTPLAWREVKKGLSPSDFTISNAPARFARVGDLFRGVLEKPQRLEPALERLGAGRG